MSAEQGSVRPVRPGAVVGGIVLLALGVAMGLESTEALSIEPGRLIAPFVLIGIGVSILSMRGRSCTGRTVSPSHARRGDGSTGALWMIGIGCWLLISQTHMFGLSFGTSWPLLLILTGALIAIRGWR